MAIYQTNLASYNWKLFGNHNYGFIEASNSKEAMDIFHGFFHTDLKQVDEERINNAVENTLEIISEEMKSQVNNNQRNITFNGFYVEAKTILSGKKAAFIIGGKSVNLVQKLTDNAYWKQGFLKKITIRHTWDKPISWWLKWIL